MATVFESKKKHEKKRESVTSTVERPAPDNDLDIAAFAHGLFTELRPFFVLWGDVCWLP